MSLTNNLLSPSRANKRLFPSVADVALSALTKGAAIRPEIAGASTSKRARVSDHTAADDTPCCSSADAPSTAEEPMNAENSAPPQPLLSEPVGIGATTMSTNKSMPVTKPIYVNASSQTDLNMHNSVISPIPERVTENRLVSALVSPQKTPFHTRSTAPRLARAQSTVTISNVNNVAVSRKLTSFVSMQSVDVAQLSNGTSPLNYRRPKRLEHTRTAAVDEADVVPVPPPETPKNHIAPKSKSVEKNKKRLAFGNVDVYSFKYSHSYDTVPSEGGVPLGMEYKHCDMQQFPIDVYDSRRKIDHMLANYDFSEGMPVEKKKKRSKKDTAGTQTAPSLGRHLGHSLDERPGPSTRRNVRAAAASLDQTESASARSLEPLSKNTRLTILKTNNIPLDKELAKDCITIRLSREQCGCSCRNGVCLKETCECARNGIECHADRLAFPCNCSRSSCQNPDGRYEFDEDKVKVHFEETMKRVRAEERHQENAAKRTPASSPARANVRVSSPLFSEHSGSPFIIPLVPYDRSKRPLTTSFEKLGLNTPPPPANNERSPLRSKITTQFSSSIPTGADPPIPLNTPPNVTRRRRRHPNSTSRQQDESSTDAPSLIELDSTGSGMGAHQSTTSMEVDPTQPSGSQLPTENAPATADNTRQSDNTTAASSGILLLVNNNDVAIDSDGSSNNVHENSDATGNNNNVCCKVLVTAASNNNLHAASIPRANDQPAATEHDDLLLLTDVNAVPPASSFLSAASRSLSAATTTTDETSRTNSTEMPVTAEDFLLRAANTSNAD